MMEMAAKDIERLGGTVEMADVGMQKVCFLKFTVTINLLPWSRLWSFYFNVCLALEFLLILAFSSNITSCFLFLHFCGRPSDCMCHMHHKIAVQLCFDICPKLRSHGSSESEIYLLMSGLFGRYLFTLIMFQNKIHFKKGHKSTIKVEYIYLKGI